MNTPTPQPTSLKRIREIIDLNPDARRYFYARADEKWFDWLQKNGFLEVVKQAPESAEEFTYRTPELDYLARVVEKIPQQVVNFMLSFNVPATSNRETLDRFLWIATKLSAEELSRLVPKIHDEHWLKTTGNFRHWSFGYKDMLERLASAGDSRSLLLLVEAVLSVRSKEDADRNSFGSIRDPFYIQDIHYTEVFERLDGIEDVALLEAAQIALKVFAEVLLLAEKQDEVFTIGDLFPLFDTNFFTLELSTDPHHSSRDDVKDLVAVMKSLITRYIARTGDDPDSVRAFYDSNIASLPDARAVWRLKLYVWCLCPEVFKKELREGFFRIFEHENPFPVAGGAEYEYALKRTFHLLSTEDQRLYIELIFERFSSEKRPAYGYGALSSIFVHLTEEDKRKGKEIFGTDLNPDFDPTPSIGESFAGMVVPQTPADAVEGFKKEISEIVELLKTKWTPQSLYEQHKTADFLRPINAEGIGNRLKDEVKENLGKYIAGAELFFDRGSLDSHFTYSYLRGVHEALRADRFSSVAIDWSPLIVMAKNIIESSKSEAFDHKGRDREQFDSWLSSWRDVHSALADVIHELLQDVGGHPVIEFDKHRESLIEIVSYLLSFPSPEPADEQIETAMSKTKDSGEEEYLVSDPHTIAINTTRGRAFEAYLQLVFQDGKQFPKEAKEKLSKEMKSVFEETLGRENTQAIMFMFGRFLYFFFFRDEKWTRKQFPKIFTEDEAKKTLYIAAWEGYLSSTLYPELFEELHNEYGRAIWNKSSDYPKRKYQVNLDEGLAIHLALAYLHFEEFTFTTDLYVAFWNNANSIRQKEFISFMGRHVVSREGVQKWLKDNPEVKPDKMLLFWDWALENLVDPEVFESFGFWINTKAAIFPPAELARRTLSTLQKSNGKIDWDYGLMESLLTLAQAAPRESVEILRLYFIEMDTSPQKRGIMHIDADLVEVFRVLFRNPDTKEETHKLITELLPIGGGVYWILKQAMENTKP